MAVLAVALLALGLASAASPAQAAAPAVTQQAQTVLVDTCNDDAAFHHIELNDSFYCLGPQWNWPMPAADFDGECRNLSSPFFQDGGHPAPNGWSNAISSVVNADDDIDMLFYDAFGCGGAVLYAVNALTTRDTLVAAANNKASSVKFKCKYLFCPVDQ
jgi:hypothetical protein